jgi:hypothetical protein
LSAQQKFAKLSQGSVIFDGQYPVLETSRIQIKALLGMTRPQMIHHQFGHIASG